MIWLGGNTFYGKRQIFEPDFLEWLSNFQLPEYELTRRDGQYDLNFYGPWMYTTMWEIPALTIINELRSRAAMKKLGRFELDVLYARAKAKMWSKVERLRALPDIRISDFGTRRRHSFPLAALVRRSPEGRHRRRLSPARATCLMAMDNDLEALGTNAHELPMVLAALSTDQRGTAEITLTRCLQDWNRYYGGNLLIVLARRVRNRRVPA